MFRRFFFVCNCLCLTYVSECLAETGDELAERIQSTEELAPLVTADNELVPQITSIEELVPVSKPIVESPKKECVLTSEERLDPTSPESASLETYLCSVSETGCRDYQTAPKVIRVNCVGRNREQCLALGRNTCDDEIALDPLIYCPHKNGACTTIVNRTTTDPAIQIPSECILSRKSSPRQTARATILAGTLINAQNGIITTGGAEATCFYTCGYSCQKREFSDNGYDTPCSTEVELH